LKIKTQCLTYAINQNWGGGISWDIIVIDPKKPNVNMVAATVHTRQQLKRVEKASLLPLFKNNLRNPFKL
jgi:hypothetical protein